MKFYWLLIFIVLTQSNRAFAQDPSFSQIENTRLYVHSSERMVNCGWEFEMAHRSQWNEITGGFTTNFASGFYQSEKTRSGFGFKYMNDVEGSASIKTEDLKFVYRFSFFPHSYYNTKALNFSVEFGGIRKSVDWSKLVFSDQLDPVWGIYKNSTQQIYDQRPVVFGDYTISSTFKHSLKLAGINRVFNASASWRHISVFSDKQESLLRQGVRLPGILTITASTSFTPITYYKLPLFKPVIRYEIQRNLKRIVWGTLAGIASETNKQTLYVGTFISNQYNPANEFNTNGMIIMVGLEKLIKHTYYSIAYSYDYNVGGMTNASTLGAHELTLNIALEKCTNEFDQISNIFNKCPQ